MRGVRRQPRGLEGIKGEPGKPRERMRVAHRDRRRQVIGGVREQGFVTGVHRWVRSAEVGHGRSLQRPRARVVEADLAQAYPGIVSEPVVDDPKVADREGAAVRADGQLWCQTDRQRERAGHRGVTLQRCQQRPFRLRRAIESDRLTRQQHRPVQPRLGHRLRPQLPGQRHAGLVAGALLVDQRDHASGDRNKHQRNDRREDRPQAGAARARPQPGSRRGTPARPG